MRRRKFITMLGGAAIAWPLAARAQQANSIPKVGFLYPGPEAYAKMRSAVMLEGLRTQGFREPERVVVLVRATGGDPARLAPLFAELVANKIDILLPMGGLTLTLAADAAAANIPIVTYDLELDPIESGLLKNLAHPGGNVTGIFLDLPEISTALLELLKQAIPRLVSIVVLWDPSMPAMARHTAVLAAAQRLNITTDVMEVKTPAELDPVFEAASARHPDGLLMLTAPLFSIYSKHIAELTLKHRLPAISMFSSFARAGGLMAYGPNLEGISSPRPLVPDTWVRPPLDVALYLQAKVFQPSSAGSATLGDDPANQAPPALAYRSEGDTEPGWNPGKMVESCGCDGWYLSVWELLNVMGQFRRDGSILTPAAAQAMLDNGFGVDPITTNSAPLPAALPTPAGNVYCKPGDWHDNNGHDEQTLAYFLPEDMELAVFVNSTVNGLNATQNPTNFFRCLVTQTYLDNLTTQPPLHQ